MGQIYSFPGIERSTNHNHTDAHVDCSHGGGGGGGGDTMMLERVKSLEEKTSTIVTDLAIIKATHSTKEDLQREIANQTKWIVATLIATAGVTLAIAKYVL